MKGYKLIVISSVILLIYGLISVFSVAVISESVLMVSPLLFVISLLQGLIPSICGILGILLGRNKKYVQLIFILSIIQLFIFYFALCLTYGQPVLTIVFSIVWFLVGMVYFTGAKRNRREVLND